MPSLPWEITPPVQIVWTNCPNEHDRDHDSGRIIVHCGATLGELLLGETDGEVVGSAVAGDELGELFGSRGVFGRFRVIFPTL